jgi:hypothetical protein
MINFLNKKRDKAIKITQPNDLNKIKKNKYIIFSTKSMFMMSNDVMIIDNSSKMPVWWKNIKRGNGSLSSCHGVVDYLKNGFTMPMWADIEFSYINDSWAAFYDLDTPYGNFGIDEFSYDQVGECPATDVREIKNSSFIKLQTPWAIKTPKGWSCLILPALWEPRSDYSIMPGVVNTDYYHHINVIINPTTKENFEINFKDNLIHIIPFKRQKNLKHIWGDDSVYSVLWHKSYGKVFKSINTRGLYRKCQKEIDEQKK